MGESKRPSRLRRALFDRPILKLLMTLLAIGVLFKVVESTSKVWESWPVIGFLIALLGLAVVIYFIVLILHIVGIYLIRKPLERLFTAKDIVSLLFSYVLFVAGILLVASVLFMVVENLHLGYLTYDPTVKLSSDMIEDKDPNLSQDYLYFTAVTFFSVGYGDVCPVGLCKPLAMMTAFAGNIVTVVLMAIVVSVYLNRRTKPSDQATDVQSGRSPQD